jgi:hypothetical protein
MNEELVQTDIITLTRYVPLSCSPNPIPDLRSAMFFLISSVWGPSQQET